MADQNDQQNPPAAPTAPPVASPAPANTNPAPTALQSAENRVEQTFSSVVKDLWSRYGILFVLIGIGLIALKFGSIAMDVLGWSSKKDLQGAIKTDEELKAQEDSTNKQADALVKEANDLPTKEGRVDDDWDKKQGN